MKYVRTVVTTGAFVIGMATIASTATAEMAPTMPAGTTVRHRMRGLVRALPGVPLVRALWQLHHRNQPGRAFRLSATAGEAPGQPEAGGTPQLLQRILRPLYTRVALAALQHLDRDMQRIPAGETLAALGNNPSGPNAEKLVGAMRDLRKLATHLRRARLLSKRGGESRPRAYLPQVKEAVEALKNKWQTRHDHATQAVRSLLGELNETFANGPRRYETVGQNLSRVTTARFVLKHPPRLLMTPLDSVALGNAYATWCTRLADNTLGPGAFERPSLVDLQDLLRELRRGARHATGTPHAEIGAAIERVNGALLSASTGGDGSQSTKERLGKTVREAYEKRAQTDAARGR